MICIKKNIFSENFEEGYKLKILKVKESVIDRNNMNSGNIYSSEQKSK